MRYNNIHNIRTAPYQPSSNGLAERAVETYKSSLRKMTRDTVHEKANRFLFKCRTTPHSTTGVTSAELMFNRTIKTRLDKIHDLVAKNVTISQMNQKRYHDKNFKAREITVQDPELKTSLVSPKIHTRFGYEITGKNNITPCSNPEKAMVNDTTLDIACTSRWSVKYIHVSGPGTADLCSLYISRGRNVALQQQAHQSTKRFEGWLASNSLWQAKNAVDGKLDIPDDEPSQKATCTHTNGKDRGWWTVSFTEPVNVYQFLIYNRRDPRRRDCCEERLKGFKLTVPGEKKGKTLFQYNDTSDSPKHIYNVVPPKIIHSVSKVKIQVDIYRKILTLCEVKVFGACDIGKYGSDCSLKCNTNCAGPDDVCDHITGTCTNGCEDGYRGNMCDKKCPTGKYGFGCSQVCNTNCAGSDDACDHIKGTCTNGCEDGYRGDKCNLPCPTGKYGSSCLKTCNNTCNGSDNACDHINGTCTNGCEDGYVGDMCERHVAWTHKWLAAKVNIENIAIKIAGIDMSAAFDTINRETLLKILEDIVNEDEHRIIRFLLSNIIINTKIFRATEKKPFFSNVGTPQGDSLSPVLFTIYLEHALKELVRLENTDLAVHRPATPTVLSQTMCVTILMGLVPLAVRTVIEVINARKENTELAVQRPAIPTVLGRTMLATTLMEPVPMAVKMVIEVTCATNVSTGESYRKKIRVFKNNMVFRTFLQRLKNITATLTCPTGKYGSKCSQTCNTNCAGLDDSCDHIDGTCTNGCEDGFLGEMCNMTCRTGTYGSNCSQTCNNNCAGLDDACHNVHGACIRGCEDGYTGEKCDRKCPNGTYGFKCSKFCHVNCAGSDDACDHINGTCTNGCEDGYRGDMCDSPCSPGTYGSRCSQTCNTNCNGSDDACDHINGTCTNGCEDGYVGDWCNGQSSEVALPHYQSIDEYLKMNYYTLRMCVTLPVVGKKSKELSQTVQCLKQRKDRWSCPFKSLKNCQK
ncbi:multiple epidermal growth factor-like domains 6, partial [Elysia marginata]